MTRPPLDARGLSALVRPRIAILVLVVSAAGFLLERPSGLAPLPWLLVGTLFVAAAGTALNHLLERDADARMERTRLRPLVTGALTPRQVLSGGVVCAVIGLASMAVGTNPTALALEAAALVVYLGIYTPMKRRTSTNTWVGAIPGALPLLAGAAAAGGPSRLSLIAFTLLFLWQMPHFFAIASMYREDYRSGGLRVLSGDDPDDALLRWQMPLQVMSVMLISFLPATLGLVGPGYALVALLVGAVFLASAFAFRLQPDRARARRVVLASVIYLPLVMGALVLDVACGHVEDAHLHGEHGVEVAGATAACADCAMDAPEDVMACELCVEGEGVAAVEGPVDADAEAEDGGESVDDLASRLAELSGASAPAPVDDGTGLPNHGGLPAFSLISETGAPFGLDDLRGKVWVVDFIFANCAGPCPVMSQKFVELEQQGFAGEFLSITVDPRRDGPAELRAYRERHGGDADRWRLLTGQHEAIQSLAEAGFRLPVNSGVEPVAGMAPMFHSGKFALVDTEGRVRGYYDYRDSVSMDQLTADAARLVEAAAEG